MQLLDAARMGWWKADFRTSELLFSDYVVNLLGLGSNRAAVGELMPLTREDYRKRIHNEFLSLKVGNHFDETFPLVLPEGEVWIHAQLVRKQSDSQQGIKLFGYLQRVPVADRKEAADVEPRVALYDKILKAEQALDRNIARIESIERSLLTLDVLAETAPKLRADRERINAARDKLRAETDILTSQRRGVVTPVSDIVSSLHEMSNSGRLDDIPEE